MEQRARKPVGGAGSRGMGTPGPGEALKVRQEYAEIDGVPLR
jgi:hypothetical protein